MTSQLLYEKYRKSLEQKFQKLFESYLPRTLYDPSAYIMKSGGKRLRPILVMLSAGAAGGNVNKVKNAAVAVELFHNFTLVHDDIMDNADKRRNNQTVHKKYDSNTAILTGDNLIAHAYNYLLKDCSDNNKKVINIFSQGIVEVCEGQSYDEAFETSANVSIDDYLKMIKKKTAALLEVCCSIGARLGGADPKTIRALENYGLNTGIAFQLRDDLLDIFGSEDKFGKMIGGDLIQGKKTFLFLKAMQNAKGDDKNLLKSFIRNYGIKRKDVSKFKKLYEKLGVLDDTEKEILYFNRRAIKSLNSIKDSNYKETLIWLVNDLSGRKN